mmetsp:Transcript_51373/g.117115  ORF Transcript_51373/g.117115 Transcript_51373/m.117115 type:complete len:235 (+) Transcript_51373:1393-2097(+)
MPAAMVTACCSAMPTSNIFVGCARPKMSMPVPPGMAAVMPTTLSSFLAMSTSSEAKTVVSAGGPPGAPFCCLPVATSNLATPCMVSLAASAGGYPWPFTVLMCSRMGFWMAVSSRMFSRMGTRLSRSCPSMGPTYEKPSSSKSVPPETMPRAYSSIRLFTSCRSLGSSLLTCLSAPRKSWKGCETSSREVYVDSAETGAVPPAEGVPVGSDTCPLSLSTTTSRCFRKPALFMAS